MSPIPSLAAVLLALTLPAGAEKPDAAAALRRVVVPEPPATAGAAAAVPQGLTPAPVVIVDSPAVDLIDGGAATYGFHVENSGTSPLPAPFTIDFEAFGLSFQGGSPAGWTCTFTPPTGTCTWPSDLPPGGATTTVTADFDVTGPYGDALTCEGNRSPCVWFQVGLGTDVDRVFTAVAIGGNHPPVAGDDTFYTRGAAPPQMFLDVLLNDGDETFPLSVEIAAPPANGNAVVDPGTGVITYTAGPGYVNYDTFRYRVIDSEGATDTADVVIRELTGGISFDSPLLDIGQVEIEHVAMLGAWMENTTGSRLEGEITVRPVPAAEAAAVLAGTGYDPALVAFDPFAFKPVDGEGYVTFDAGASNFTTHSVRPLAPLGTVWLAKFTYDLHPPESWWVTVSASVYAVARSATAAEVPLHVVPDVIDVPADVATMLRPLANDDSTAGNVLSVTAIYTQDPWYLDPDTAVGQFEFADAQGPDGTVPFLGILYTPPPGYTGTNAVWYAASEIVGVWRRYDFAKIALNVGAVPQPPVAAASGDATICAGGSAPLSGSGGVSCAWTPAAGLSDPASCTPIASPSATTTYALTVTDQHGQQSTNSATVTITVEPLPIASASGSATIPFGGSAPLAGSGGVSCAWSPAAGLDDAASCSPIASPTGTTTYALAVTSAAGCVSVNPASATITVLPPAGGADLIVGAVLAPNQARQGEPIDIRALTINVGTAAAAASQTRVYLSADQLLDAGDQLLVTAVVPGLNAGQFDLSPTLTVPAPAVAPGQYYLIAAADAGGVVVETDEANNAASSRIHIKRDRP